MGITSEDLYFRPKLRVINDKQMEKIHMATLEVLENTGIKMTHPEGVELLEAGGAKVKGDIIKIPSWMVEKALATVPHRLVLGNQRGERTIFLEDANSYYGPSLDCMNYMDPKTHKRIRFTSEHSAATAALCDGLDSFDWCMIIGMADDVPADIADRVVVRNTLQNCEKPLVFCCKDTNSVKDVYEMGLLLCDGEENFQKAPFLVHYSEPISPLVYYDPAVDKIIFCSKKSIPLINFPCLQTCGSAPATFAGTIVQGSAESLSGLVLHQLANPGAPFIYGAFTSIMDMKTTIFSYGANELSLMKAAMAQMSQYYKLPFFGTAGATDSKFCDAQAGAEVAFQCLAAGTVGSGLVHDCSSWMDHGDMVSPEFMVLADDIVNSVHHFMRGIPLTKETLALDIIDKIAPGGHYLAEKHTMDHFKKIKYSELFDRTVYAKWEEAGSKKFEERLQALTLKKMEHKPRQLDAKIIKELDAMQASWK